ncbi:hypothetical protein FB567DRAFT_594863 [Paraphoma chrysanthemicola]|uniref:Ankyrin n=1 Tax=Paraphoma chrysanthemicola TaxID=798071 RepID=A0A8K0VWT9_9PLEO|nr:hypothetical protein FB567DRAFT_594863 [Paraphoma chrysanthemicola]
MNLLDLSPEIFQHIVHDFVSIVGIRKAWNARKVCLTFAVETQYDVLHLQPLTKDDVNWFGYDRSIRPLPKAYPPSIIRSRLNKPPNSFPGFLNKTHRMARSLRDAMESSRQESEETVTTLCESLAQGLPGYRLELALTSDVYLVRHYGGASDGLGSGPLLIVQKLIAVVLVNDCGLVLQSFPDLLEKDEWQCPFFGCPLSLAVAQKSKDMARTILQWLLVIHNQGLPPSLDMSRTEQGFNIVKAIDNAFAHGSLEILQDLLSFHSRRFGPADRTTYDTWLWRGYTKCSINTSYLEAVLAAPSEGQVKITREALVKAMRYYGPSHLETLITNKALNVHRVFGDTTPLIAAARGGILDNIRAILDAGADIDFELGSPSNRISAMTIAIRTKLRQDTKVSIVQLLLERGATLPPVHTWSEVGKRGTSQIRALLEEEQKKRNNQA